jgi:membrane associated rhomboid family serine protease
VPLLPLRDVQPTAIRPLVTWAVILANVFIFFWVQPQQGPEAEEFAYRHAAIACELSTGAPLERRELQTGECVDEVLGDQLFPQKNVWLSVGAAMFLHAGLAHLFFNMWVLYIFGNNVEEAFGHLGYAIFYGVAGVAATVGFVVANPDLTIPLVGASGAIAGVMGAYLVLFPRHLILTLVFFRIVAIPAVVFLGFWFLSQFLLAAEETNIAWEAHVAGFVFGALLVIPFREWLLARTLESRPIPARPFGY